MEMEQPTPIPLKKNESTEETVDTVTRLESIPIVSNNINAEVVESTVPKESLKKSGDDENEAEEEDPEVIEIGCDDEGNGAFPHSVTNVDKYIESYRTCDPKRKRLDYALFDTVRVDSETTSNAYVAVGPFYLVVPKLEHKQTADIKQELVRFDEFCEDNARFIRDNEAEGGQDSSSEDYGLGIRIVVNDTSGNSAHVVECIFNGADPNRIVTEGRTVEKTLRQFAKSFVKFHKKWRKSNPEVVEQLAEQALERQRQQQQYLQRNAQSTESTTPTSRCKSPIARTNERTYQPPSRREALLNDFAAIISEESPCTDLTDMIIAWNEDQISSDDMICNLAGVLSARAVRCFNDLLPREYSIKTRYGTSVDGNPLLLYRSPNGLRTTDKRARQLVRALNCARSSNDELYVVDSFMRPVPESYHDMKSLDLSTIIRGCIACEDFNGATHILELVETVVDAQDFDSAEGAMGLVHDLRGQVLLDRAKYLLAHPKKHPFEQYRCGRNPFSDDESSDVHDENGQIYQLLGGARDDLLKAKDIIETVVSEELRLEDLQDLCTLNMRIGKTYELQGRISEATYAFEQALDLLHQVRPPGSSRIAAAHMDLGDLFASTLIPGPEGYWDGDNQSIPKAVAHYLSSAASVAIALATQSGSGAESLFVTPGDNILLDTMNQVEKQEELELPINLGRWALVELSQMKDVLLGAVTEVMHRGQEEVCLARMHFIQIRKRLEMMARHPMYGLTGGSGRAIKKRRLEGGNSHDSFYLQEGDSHDENAQPSFGYGHNHVDNNPDEPDLTIGKPGDYNEVSEFPDFSALGPMEGI